MRLAADVDSLVEAAQAAQHAAGDVGRTVRTVDELREASRRLQELVQLLSATARQANVVALNALAEAHRFGEAGRGFALVARELAEMSREAVRMTDDMDRHGDALDAVLGTAVTATTAVGSRIQTLIALLQRLTDESDASPAALPTLSTGRGE